jgi:hypothetical protein
MHRTSLYRVSVTLVMLLFLGLTRAEAQISAKGQPSRSTTQKTLVVNGTSVEVKILVDNDQDYVRIEDLARSLGGSVSYQGK